MPLEWLRRNRNVAAPLGWFLLSISLLSYHSYEQRTRRLSPFAIAILDTVGFGQRAVTALGAGARDLVRHYLWLKGVEEENRKLRAENQTLLRENRRLREQVLEVQRLRRLLHFRPREEIGGWIPARVIGISMPGAPRSITIDKGRLDGVRRGMAVITYEGALVGQILDEPGSAIGLKTSQVLLITDLRSRVHVLVQRPDSRARGILAGNPSTGDCLLLYAEDVKDLQEGDLLITSGLGGVFMKGWVAGQVKTIELDPAELSPHIRVKPAADFSRLEEVVVILPPGEHGQ